MAMAFRNSGQQFSSLPAVIETCVLSGTSPLSDSIRNADGNDLLLRQCAGSWEQIILGAPVRVNSL